MGIYPEMVYASVTPFEAVSIGWSRTLGSFVMIIESLRMIGSGEASVKDLGGPIMIAQLAGRQQKLDDSVFHIYGFAKCNLAFLNILPIPGLDGGHLFIHLVESLMKTFNLKDSHCYSASWDGIFTNVDGNNYFSRHYEIIQLVILLSSNTNEPYFIVSQIFTG